MDIKSTLAREKRTFLVMTVVILASVGGSGLLTYKNSRHVIDNQVPEVVKQELQKSSEQVPEFVTPDTLSKQSEILDRYSDLIPSIKAELNNVTRDSDNTEALSIISSKIVELKSLVEQARNLYTDDTSNTKKWSVFNGFIGLYAEGVDSSLSNYTQNMFDEGNKFLDSANKNLNNISLASDFYVSNQEELQNQLAKIKE